MRDGRARLPAPGALVGGRSQELGLLVRLGRAGIVAHARRARAGRAGPCASEAHEESELDCGQDLSDAKSVCWCAQECTTTAAYYDGSQDLSAHDPS